MSFDTLLAKSQAIIFKPGGVNGGLVVNTWAKVQEFIAFREGTVIVYVDDSIVSPALVPGASGLTDCEGRVELRPFKVDSTLFTVLQVEPGATLRDLYQLTAMDLRSNAQNATPSLDFTSASGGNLYVREFGQLSNAATATQPGIVIPNGKTTTINLEEGNFTLNAPAVPLVQVQAGGFLEVILDAVSFLSPGYAGGAGGVILLYDQTSGNSSGAGTPPALPALTGSYRAQLLDPNAIIYKPGITSSPFGRLVGTWAEVKDFISNLQGTGVVYVDDSIVSPALVPAATGITDCQNKVEIRSFRQDELNFTTLVVQDGATLKNLYKINSTMVVLGDTQGATPAFDWDYTVTVVGAPGPVLFLRHAFIGSTATATQPCITIAAGHLLEFDIADVGGVSQGGASSIISVAGQFQAFLHHAELLGPGFAQPIGANWISGAGQVFLGYDTDTITASQQVQPTAAATNNLFLLDAQFGAVIFKPGAATRGNTVETWAEVQGYIRDHKGMVVVYVDDSIVSPALVPGASGITDCQGRVTLRPFKLDASIFTILQVEAGATLRDLVAVQAMELRCNPTNATRSLSFSAAGGGEMFVEEGGMLSNAATATQPAVDAGLLLNILNGGFLTVNAPGVPIINVPLGQTLLLQCFDGITVTDGFAAGAGTVDFAYDATTAHFFATPGTPPALPGVTGAYNKIKLDDIWLTKQLDPVTMAAPNVNDVPHFDGTKWVAGPVPASSILSEQTIVASGVFAPTTVDVLVFVDTTGGAVNLTLPAPVAGVATRYTFKDSKQNFNVNALTLVPPGAVLIEGVNANFPINAQGAHVTVISDGVNYFV